MHLLPIMPRQDTSVMEEDVGIQRPIISGFLWYRNINCPKTQTVTSMYMSCAMYTCAWEATQNNFTNYSFKPLILAQKY